MAGVPPGNNLTDEQLRFGYWFATHRLLLQKILIGALIVANAALWLPGVYLLIRLFLVDGPAYRRMKLQASMNLVNPRAVAAARPKPPEVRGLYVFGISDNRYDAVAIVRNPNPSRYARFSYQFVGDGVTSPEATGLLLPGKETPLSILGFESKTKPRALRLEYENFVWQRVDRHDAADPAAWLAERSAIVAREAQYSPGPPARVHFTIANETAFGFWSVDATVLLRRSDAVVGVNRITIEKLKSGEARAVELSVFDSVGAVTNVDVIPSADIFDPAAYMAATP